VKFKGKVVFKQYIPKKRKHFGIKMFNLCNHSSYTYDMNVYLGKDTNGGTKMTATYATVTNLTKVVEEFGHKLHMDNFSSSPDLFDNLAQKNFPFVGQ